MAAAAVSCPKCGAAFAPSDDERILFARNFACLRCGHRFPMPLDAETTARLAADNDRNRRPPPK